jgi:murein DD-endopeptidase MepM/ murein hydrolase activator NlpD
MKRQDRRAHLFLVPLILIFVFVLIGIWYAFMERVVSEEVTNPAEVMGPEIPPAFEVVRSEGEFGRDSNLRDVFVENGFTPQELHYLVEDAKDVYDFNKVKSGATYSLEKYADGRFRRFLYNISREEYVVVLRNDIRYQAIKVERPVEVREAFIDGIIQTSLWDTITAQGESGELVMSIYEPMQWDVDFFALQSGDTFRVILEKKFCEGEFLGYGQVKAITFHNGGKDFYAFLFMNPETGKSSYFDYDGKGVKKAFLKAPFKYDHRISSNFSYSRLHPVHKVRRPHYGVDYAAPTGTPVLASASGRIVDSRHKGANGNYVKIRHTNGFHTYYLHLSRLLVKAGQSVSQGQRIGLVGMTGVATGPHLDYRIQDNRGKWLNPRKMVALPSETGIKKTAMSAYITVRDAFIQRLNRIDNNLLMADGAVDVDINVPVAAAR